MKIPITVFIITILIFLLIITVFIIIKLIDNNTIAKLKSEKNLIQQDRSKLEAELKENKKITDKKDRLLSEVSRIRTQVNDETSDSEKNNNYKRYIDVWNGIN